MFKSFLICLMTLIPLFFSPEGVSNESLSFSYEKVGCQIVVGDDVSVLDFADATVIAACTEKSGMFLHRTYPSTQTQPQSQFKLQSLL